MNNAQRQRQKSPEALDDKFFRLMVESVTDHAVIGIDIEGRILSWNAGAEIIFGYTKEEVVEKHFSTLFTPEDRQSGVPERELENARTRGSAGDFGWQMRFSGQPLVLGVRTKDGRNFEFRNLEISSFFWFRVRVSRSSNPSFVSSNF